MMRRSIPLAGRWICEPQPVVGSQDRGAEVRGYKLTIGSSRTPLIAAGVALGLLVLLPGCGGSSKPSTSAASGTTTTLSLPPDGSTKASTSSSSGGSAATPSSTSSPGALPPSTSRVLPARVPAGSPPLRCDASTGFIGPFDKPPPGTPASDVAAFSFPPPEAEAYDRPPNDSDIAGFIVAFRAARKLPDDIDFVVIDGSARAARIPSTGQDWGMASFRAAAGETVDPKRGADLLEPPINNMLFVRADGCPWAYREIWDPFPCPNARDLPAGVREAWGLQPVPIENCDNVSRRNLVR